MHNKYQFKITFLTQFFWLKRAPSRGKLLYKIMGGAIFFQISEKGAILKISLGNPALDQQNDTYYSHRKCNAKEMYININSNHLPNVKKELPNMILNRLSALSKNKVMFDYFFTLF